MVSTLWQNASIETARAGEGFAVVADEIIQTIGAQEMPDGIDGEAVPSDAALGVEFVEQSEVLSEPIRQINSLHSVYE